MDYMEVFAEYSPKMLSSGEINMQCPFRENHSEDSQKRRQMNVNPDKNMYHCFSCGKRGTVVALLTTKFEIPLDMAVTLVTEKFVEEITKEPEKETYECVTHVPDHILSWDTQPMEFIKRGFSVDLLKRMNIGINTYEGCNVITIPLMQDGRLVGIKYRAIGSKEFWYSPDFEKRRYIYNEPSGKKIVVVESETDTLMSITNGIDWVGAVLGTEVSHQQLHRMKKYERIYSAFDNDDAGMLATEKFYLKARNLDVELLFVPYDAHDPGECQREKWVKGLVGATDYAEYSYIMGSILGNKYFDIQQKARKFVLGK